MSENCGRNQIKIILAGLDNAGKTSMLVAVKKMYGFVEDVKQLKPTVRIEYYHRNFLNLELNFWDMGGQEKYREIYLKRNMYFMDINQLIYLIDIQDETRFNESIGYLGKILEILRENGYDKSKEVFICFSKMDYEQMFTEKPEYIEHMAMIRKLIFKEYPDFKFRFYSTSIFNIYSIVKMISESLKAYVPGYKDIIDALEDYGTTYGPELLLLFDSTGLIIADFIKNYNDQTKNMLDKIINEHLEFYKQIEEECVEIMSSRGFDGKMMNCCFQFSISPKEETEKEKNGKQNFYVSLIVRGEKGIEAEGKIGELLNIIKTKLNQIVRIYTPKLTA